MSRNRKRRAAPGEVVYRKEDGVHIRIDENGEEEEFELPPWDPDFEGKDDSLDDIPIRPDGSVSPFYDLDHDQLERLGQDTPARDARRARHDGWTLERQKMFIETLAATASVSDACRYVGLSRQGAHKLYQRSPQFRAAWDDALKAAVGVLAATAFDRAVNGTQEQIWHNGRMIGFREKHHDRLLLYLLRVRDPLNYAPLDDLVGWQRRRAVEDRSGGIAPVLDRLAEAERAWEETRHEPPRLPAPVDRLETPASTPAQALEAAPRTGSPRPETRRRGKRAEAKHPSTLTTSSTKLGGGA